MCEVVCLRFGLEFETEACSMTVHDDRITPTNFESKLIIQIIQITSINHEAALCLRI